ncbi:hypothetical protein CVT25_014518 [Psilocybe cyanescens]|uniref:Uncharacterized protein n=1 Tax=Psilocybe cyanescens TaxID=93625 RepID=A0A409WR73_PSICY|nr:hypothetical protein CVT25_014518 [Psilocybe cyanescens]
MTELKSRIGPKLYNNKSWVRPSFEASPNKLGPHIWDTSDSTNEGNSDPESHNDDGAFNPPHPPTSFSNPTSPPKSLLDRMKMPIIDESLHDRPEIRELRKVQRPLIERVDFGGKTDGTFESQSRFHNIEDGMDIDQDNDSEMSSEINNQIQRAKDIHDSNGTVTDAHNQILPSRNNDSSVSHQEGDIDSHRTPNLAERMQNGHAPPCSNPSNTQPLFTKASTNNSTNNFQINNVMPHDKSRCSDSTEDGELRRPLSPDQVRVVLLPLILQNAESRIKHAELKATSSQHATVNPKVLTDQVCASFSEIGHNIRKEVESRDPPRRSPPHVDPSKAIADANAPIASTSTAKRVQSSLQAPEKVYVQNSSAYNHNVDTLSNASGPSIPSTIIPSTRSEDSRKEPQSPALHNYQGPYQRRTSDSQEPRDQDREQRRRSEPRYDGRRRSRSPPRNLPDRPITYVHERRLSDREYDYSRSRPPPSLPPRTYYISDRGYYRSLERRSRSPSRNAPYRLPYPSRERSDYSHGQGFSRDDDRYSHRFVAPVKQGSYGPYNTNRSRSPRREPRTPPPRDNNTYKSRSRSSPRRPRTPPLRGNNTYRSRSRSPLRRVPRTPPPRERSSGMSTRSPLSDKRPRSNERIDTRDRSADLSTSSKSSISKEPITQTESIKIIEPDKEPPSHSTRQTETQEAEPPEPVLPCHNVPGLWFVKVPLDTLGTLTCEFKIDHETALKWNIAQNKYVFCILCF